MTKKVSMHAKFHYRSNEEIQQMFDSDGFNVKVVTAKQGGKWIKFVDKTDATMFKLQYETMENYVNKSSTFRPYGWQHQAMGRGLRGNSINVVMAGRRTGKSMLQKVYQGYGNVQWPNDDHS